MKCLIATLLLILPLSAMAEDGYVPVDPASLQSINETNHVVVAYTILLGMILAYTAVLVVRHIKTDRSLRKFTEKK